jgi:hypothetical protein
MWRGCLVSIFTVSATCDALKGMPWWRHLMMLHLTVGHTPTGEGKPRRSIGPYVAQPCKVGPHEMIQGPNDVERYGVPRPLPKSAIPLGAQGIPCTQCAGHCKALYFSTYPKPLFGLFYLPSNTQASCGILRQNVRTVHPWGKCSSSAECNAESDLNEQFGHVLSSEHMDIRNCSGTEH